MDEKNDTIIGTYVKRDGTGWLGGYPDLAREAMTQCPVKIEVSPENLPEDEKVALVFEDENLIDEKVALEWDTEDLAVNMKPVIAKDHYSVRKINSQKFYLFNEMGTTTSKKVEAKHEDSSARDVVKYDVCCCTFTIYVDANGSFGGDVGHSFCKIELDAGHWHLVPDHLTKYSGVPYGFYPIPKGKGKTNEYYDVGSQFIMEEEHFDNVNGRKFGTAMHVWHISFNGCLSGLQRMYEIETTEPNYDLMCFNCTDVAISIGRACGVPVPDAGMPDLAAFESIRGGLNGDTDWAQSIWNLWKDSDGSYSSPTCLFLKLLYTNWKYGENE